MKLSRGYILPARKMLQKTLLHLLVTPLQRFCKKSGTSHGQAISWLHFRSDADCGLFVVVVAAEVVVVVEIAVVADAEVVAADGVGAVVAEVGAAGVVAVSVDFVAESGVAAEHEE